jgi:hypothetical protein
MPCAGELPHRRCQAPRRRRRLPRRVPATRRRRFLPPRHNQAWSDLAVDRGAGAPQYRALLADLEILAADFSYFAAYDLPVLLRPYYEMNGPWFWWGGKTPATYR